MVTSVPSVSVKPCAVFSGTMRKSPSAMCREVPPSIRARHVVGVHTTLAAQGECSPSLNPVDELGFVLVDVRSGVDSLDPVFEGLRYTRETGVTAE